MIACRALTADPETGGCMGRSFLTCVVGLLAMTSVTAAPVTWDFTANVTGSSNNYEYFQPDDVWQGQIVFEGAAIGSPGAYSYRTNYDNAILSVTMWSSNTTISFSTNAEINQIVVQDATTYNKDLLGLYLINTKAPVTINGDEVVTRPRSYACRVLC